MGSIVALLIADGVMVVVDLLEDTFRAKINSKRPIWPQQSLIPLKLQLMSKITGKVLQHEDKILYAVRYQVDICLWMKKLYEYDHFLTAIC